MICRKNVKAGAVACLVWQNKVFSLMKQTVLLKETPVSYTHLNRFFEVYGFLGPQISVAKSQNVDVTISADGTSQSMAPAGEAEMREMCIRDSCSIVLNQHIC